MIGLTISDSISLGSGCHKLNRWIHSSFKAACKRTQQLPTLLRQQCWELLRACWQWCANGCNNYASAITEQKKCWELLAENSLSGFKPCATTLNNMQQGVQTEATCNIQQCWELLANNVASVCTGLKVTWSEWSLFTDTSPNRLIKGTHSSVSARHCLFWLFVFCIKCCLSEFQLRLSGSGK